MFRSVQGSGRLKCVSMCSGVIVTCVPDTNSAFVCDCSCQLASFWVCRQFMYLLAQKHVLPCKHVH